MRVQEKIAMAKNEYQHAVVIGAGIAGLTTARVLSDHFEHVTIVERDHTPGLDEFRSGVPQNKQPHALMKRGLLELEQLFPGFSKEWEANGAVPVDFGHDVEWNAFGRWRPHYEPGLVSLSGSRPLLEGTVRSRLAGNAKISFMDETEVIGLTANQDCTQATGIRVRSRGGQKHEEVIEADLVVDASGRSAHTAEWLQNLGYTKPKTTIINAFPGYASRMYERPKNMDSKFIYIQPTPPVSKRGAIVLPVEGNRVHLCLIGMAKDYPPTDEAGLMNFLSTLPEKRIYDVIKDAKPVSPIVGYRHAENVLHHYDLETRWPDNFVALGDSVYAFNPVYGQGMTVAVMAAAKLGEGLQTRHLSGENLRGIAALFQQELGKLIVFPWQLATGEDMRWLPITEGCPSKLDMPTTLRLGFMKKVMVASTKHPQVAEAFYRVLNMVAGPDAFMRPGILARVLAS
jgi:2-polyprenyl-6-methoxyphenol hydroxylase-like FAD-dependent oxidoreductase